jgi:hypothetical protein
MNRRIDANAYSCVRNIAQISELCLRNRKPHRAEIMLALAHQTKGMDHATCLFFATGQT